MQTIDELEELGYVCDESGAVAQLAVQLLSALSVRAGGGAVVAQRLRWGGAEVPLRCVC